jgi:ribosomal protein S18 acetylase RimI-like enzyme
VTGLRITGADQADVVALARIIGDWVRETAWMPVLHGQAEDEGFVAGLLQSHVVRVARIGSEPLGFLARQEGRVQALHVDGAARGKGIGRALLDEVKAEEPEVTLWTFQANARALDFYRREGFAEAERSDGQTTEERLPDVCLIWRRLP